MRTTQCVNFYKRGITHYEPVAKRFQVLCFVIPPCIVGEGCGAAAPGGSPVGVDGVFWDSRPHAAGASPTICTPGAAGSHNGSVYALGSRPASTAARNRGAGQWLLVGGRSGNRNGKARLVSVSARTSGPRLRPVSAGTNKGSRLTPRDPHRDQMVLSGRSVSNVF